MTISQRYQYVIEYFEKNMPVAVTELHYNNAFELAVAVILSAQCTDKRVNQITPGLFEAFPDAYTMAKASSDQIFELIKSCSYPNNKSKHLAKMARMLVHDYNGEIPKDPDEMQKLPGIGRKTANVLGSVLFNLPLFAVDTHVFRVANRLGLTKNAKTPLASEQQLTKHFPKEVIPKAHHWLILHGRYTCLARTPRCASCGLSEICPEYKKIFKS